MIGLQETINGLNEHIGAFENAIGASSFGTIGGIPNPNSVCNGGEITGGTFTTDGSVHGSLSGELVGMNESLIGSGILGISGAGLDKSGSAEVTSIKTAGMIGAAIDNKLNKVNESINEHVKNILTLQSLFNNTFDNLLNNVDSSDNSVQGAEIENIKFVKSTLNNVLENEMKALQQVLNTHIKPSSESIKELIRKNATFAALADKLGVDYDTDEGSDRLAIAYTNLSNIGLAVEKVKYALKTLDITNKEYDKIKNNKALEEKLTNIIKNVNKPAMKSKLTKILDAIQILRNNQYRHNEVVQCLENSNKCLKIGSEDSINGGEDSINGGEDSINGGELSNNSIGRVTKFKTKSTLSRNIKTYEKTLKELFKSFMNQINTNFKEIYTAIENVTEEIGNSIPYDDKIKNFVNIFESLGQDTNNSKLFYALIVFDDSIASKEIKTRFLTNLDKLIDSLNELSQYKYLNEVKKQLLSLKENIDTYTDTVTGFKNNEVKVKEGSSDFYWTNKILDQSVTLNVSQLIKDTITKLRFYGNISQMKSSLNSTLKEFVSYKEDYDKLLGKSIGTKINELTRQYNENIDRLNNIECNRGKKLYDYNQNNPNAQIPKGLVETIYKLQYDAKIGLYKTIEAIDLYLMNFTELLSSNVEATKELNKMLQQTEVISKWYNKNSADKLFALMEKVIYDQTNPANRNTTVNDVKTFITGQTIKEVLELCKDSIDSVSMLKNILSMFVHIGDKFGNSTLSSKIYMSPNIMYKNLVKYIWVSAFTMGYGTGGGAIPLAPNNDTKPDKNGYMKEDGDKDSHFNVHFTQLVNTRDQNKAILGDVMATITASTSDIFETDDIYFVLVMKAITAKILTVIGTAHILRQPKTVVGLITNPVRSIIGGASNEPDIIDDAFELYIRLPLLVEFYKHVFEDGNKPYKKNQNANNATETIAYIPEIGSIWSGLIQCIFDESRYIKDGIYSINNMKRIIAEVNHIYKNYKNVDKNKLVRTVVLDLVADVNKRYGVLKKQEIDEFYQIKKKYIKNPNNITNVNHVNFDILDENNEFEDVGPSSKFTETIHSKSINDNILTNDITLVKDFHNKIHAELFSQTNTLKSLDKKSFTEKIKFYRNELNNVDNKKKLDIIIKAIDDSSNINSHNDDASMLFHELVASPIKNLQAVHNIIETMFESYLQTMALTLANPVIINSYQDNLNEYTRIINDINNQGNPRLYGILAAPIGLPAVPPPPPQFNKITLIEFFFSYLSNIDHLVSIKFINNNKFIIDHSKLQNVVETSIENIKYMISKFRSVLSESVIKKYEECLFNLEDKLLFKILNCDDNNEDAKYNLFNFDYLNSTIAIILDNSKNNVLQSDLYKAIMFRQTNKLNTAQLSTKGTDMKIWDDIFSQYGGARNKIWIPIHRLAPPAALAAGNNDFVHLDSLYNHLNSTSDSSILYGFNSLIYEYLCTFYDASTKKIYNNLFNEFVNKSQSSVIFGRRGIPDIYSNVIAGARAPVLPGNLGALADSLFIENDYILCESLGYMFKTIINRTTNIQMPIKNHLVTSLSEVSPNFIEKYKVYLPVFIKLFETLIHKSLLCKKVLETTDKDSAGADLINVGNAADNTPANDRSIEGDMPGDIQSFNTKWAIGTGNSKIHYNNTLNNVIEASRALINDATNVLAEINVKQQFFELKENFIKNYYNNNNALPLMPLSLNTVILHNNIVQNGVNAPYTLIPYPNKLDNEFKLLYGINSVINNKSLDNNINSYIWLKEELKNYNNSSISVNKIDVSKVNDYIEVNNKLTITLSSIIHYNQFLNQIKTNNRFKINPITAVGAIPVPCDNNDTYYTQLNAQSVLNEAIDSVDNTSLTNTKHKISNVIKQSNTTLDISRVNARFLNILDLNIVPLNIHALMREIPLTNIYNYAFTYDHIVKQLFNKEYDFNPSTPPMNCDDLLLKLFLNPYYNKCNTPIELVKALISTPSTNNPMNGKLGRSKYISDILSHALGAGINNGAAPPVSLSQFEYTDKSRGTPPPYKESELPNWVNSILTTGSLIDQQSVQKRLDNKYLRNLIFLTNLQRLIHYKIKHEVEIINSKVVSDMAITNSQIVNYDNDHPNLEETDFEYFVVD